MGQAQVQLTRYPRHQCATVEAANGIDKPARKRVVAHCDAHRGRIGVLHQTAGHFDRLLGLVSVVKIQRRKRQDDGAQRRDSLGVGVGVQQHQLSGRVAQLGRDLGLVLLESILVVAVTALLLVLQHHQGQAHCGQSQQQKCAPKKYPQAKRHPCGQQPVDIQAARQLHFMPLAASVGSAQRKPRIGTFSMPSNCASSSLNASRMVLTCLRILSRLRPLLTTLYKSS